MPLTERQQIALLFAITLAIGVLALAGAAALPSLLEGDLAVAEYEAAFFENGTLVERYTYQIETPGRYRMLFRYWEDPLVFDPISTPHIEFVGMDVPDGTIGYVRDYRGQVRTVGTAPEDAASVIRNLAMESEVGFYNPGYFPAGTYTAEYRFIIRPPIEYDDDWAHLNLRLVDEHVPYRNLRITVPAGYVEEVYPYPPTLNVEEVGDVIVITGRAEQDDALNVEMLLARGAVEEIEG
ncbi:MAG: DUF2207 domain-containing protein, partial [Methanomicrobiaceae archaeon]|nr:DUF2207 domain-containing protein [Methanomicrobiaceae archaeon]